MFHLSLDELEQMLYFIYGTNVFFSSSKGIVRFMVPIIRYHRLIRENTPDSASFRRFFLFSPWWAPAHLRLKKQKSLENPFLSGAGSFAGAEMRPDKERPAENTCRIVKGLDAVWAHFCPSKPCLPLSSDGMLRSKLLKEGPSCRLFTIPPAILSVPPEM